MQGLFKRIGTLFFWHKLIAIFLSTSFLSTTVSPSYLQASSGSDIPAFATAKDLIQQLDSLRLPEGLGIIQDRFIPEGKLSQLVIYLQSAHTNFDSETNSKRLIEFFQKEYGLDLVLLEGGEGRFDSLFFKSFPDMHMKEKVLNDYLSKGELSGAEIASILSEGYDSKYYGIETQALYDENKKAFLKAVSKEKKVIEILNQIELDLIQKSKTEFTPQTKSFFEKSQAFIREEIDLLEYVQALSSLLPLDDGYPELSKLLTVRSNELHFKGQAFDIAMNQMIQTFKEKVLPKLSKAKQMEMNQMIQMNRLGVLSQGLLVKRIQDVSKEINFTFQTPQVLQPTAKHAQTLSSIKGTKLFKELEALEAELRERLPRSNKEKDLLVDFYDLELLRNISSLEIVHEDWKKIENKNLGDLFESVAADQLNSLFESHYEFYRLALKRDQALFENMLRRMKEEKSKLTLISTGGFHSEGIIRKLKEQKIPYILISPKINQIGEKSIYLNVMEGKRSYMKYFHGNLWDALAQDYSAKLAASLRKEDLTPSLKKWRDRIIQNSIAEGRITQATQYTKYVDALVQALRKEYEKEGPLADRKEISEDEMRQRLQQELNFFASGYFNQIELILKRKLNIFSSGLQDLWKQGEINPKSIASLLDKMFAAKMSESSSGSIKTSNLAVALALINRQDSSVIEVKDPSQFVESVVGKGVVPAEGFNNFWKLVNDLATKYKDRPDDLLAARAELRVTGKINPVLNDLFRAGVNGEEAIRVLEEVGKQINSRAELRRSEEEQFTKTIQDERILEVLEKGALLSSLPAVTSRAEMPLRPTGAGTPLPLPRSEARAEMRTGGDFGTRRGFLGGALKIGAAFATAGILGLPNANKIFAAPYVDTKFEYLLSDENKDLPYYLRDGLREVRGRRKYYQDAENIITHYVQVDEEALRRLEGLPDEVARVPLEKLVANQEREAKLLGEIFMRGSFGISRQLGRRLDILHRMTRMRFEETRPLPTGKTSAFIVSINDDFTTHDGYLENALGQPDRNGKKGIHGDQVVRHFKRYMKDFPDRQIFKHDAHERGIIHRDKWIFETLVAVRAGARVLSTSLSFRQDHPRLRRAAQYASEHLFFVASAGNDTDRVQAVVRFPAAYAGVISATTKEVIDFIWRFELGYYHSSPFAKVGVPRAFLDDPGTSFAAPIVAAAIVQILISNPELTPAQSDKVLEMLKKKFAPPKVTFRSEMRVQPHIDPPVLKTKLRSFAPLKHKAVKPSSFLEEMKVDRRYIADAGILKFNGKTIFSGNLVVPKRKESEKLVQLPLTSFSKDQLVPVARAPQSVQGLVEETVPAAKGRGYTKEGFVFLHSDRDSKVLEPVTAVDFKGAGPTGFIDSQLQDGTYVDPYKVWGVFSGYQIAEDMRGEIVVRKAGLPVPKTAVLAEWEEFYHNSGELVSPTEVRAEAQVSGERLFVLGRAWEESTRVWNFTVSPYRNGPEIDQVVLGLPLPLELYYALKYRNEIQSQARETVDNYLKQTLFFRNNFEQVQGVGIGYRLSMDDLRLKDEKLYNAYLKAMQAQIYDHLIGIIRNRIFLKPYALHLANVSISGQFSGFDRIEGYTDSIRELRSGITSALIDTYAALNFLSAILTGKNIPFDQFFNGFQERVKELDPDLRDAMTASSFDDFVSKGIVPLDSDMVQNMEGYPFSARSNDDTKKLISALDATFSLLSRIYSGKIDSVQTLDRSIESSKHADLYRETAIQLYSGMPIEQAESLTQTRRDVTEQYRNLLFPDQKLDRAEMRANQIEKMKLALGEEQERLIKTLPEERQGRYRSYLLGHQERVARIANWIGRMLRLSDYQMELLEVAALYHDIGKILTPDEILFSEQALSDEQIEIVKRHVTDSRDMASKVLQSRQFSKAIAPNLIKIIGAHHENWNGKGYPNQLKGFKIPYLARVLRIADTMTAMREPRSYQKIFSVQEILTRILYGSTREFDPKVVRVLRENILDWKINELASAWGVNFDEIAAAVAAISQRKTSGTSRPEMRMVTPEENEKLVIKDLLTPVLEQFGARAELRKEPIEEIQDELLQISSNVERAQGFWQRAQSDDRNIDEFDQLMLAVYQSVNKIRGLAGQVSLKVWDRRVAERLGALSYQAGLLFEEKVKYLIQSTLPSDNEKVSFENNPRFAEEGLDILDRLERELAIAVHGKFAPAKQIKPLVKQVRKARGQLVGYLQRARKNEPLEGEFWPTDEGPPPSRSEVRAPVAIGLEKGLETLDAMLKSQPRFDLFNLTFSVDTSNLSANLSAANHAPGGTFTRAEVRSFNLAVLEAGFEANIDGSKVHVRGIYPDPRNISNYLSLLNLRTSDNQRVVPDVVRVYIPLKKFDLAATAAQQSIVLRDKDEAHLPKETLKLLKEARAPSGNPLIDLVELSDRDSFNQAARELGITDLDGFFQTMISNAHLIFASSWIGPNVRNLLEQNSDDESLQKQVGDHLGKILATLHNAELIAGDTHLRQFVAAVENNKISEILRIDLVNIFSTSEANERSLDTDNVQVEYREIVEQLTLFPNAQAAFIESYQSRRRAELRARNYYQILGIARDADDDTIKRAYRKLAREHHPDRNPGDEVAAVARFKEVQEAYDILIDKSKRANYDRSLPVPNLLVNLVNGFSRMVKSFASTKVRDGITLKLNLITNSTPLEEAMLRYRDAREQYINNQKVFTALDRRALLRLFDRKHKLLESKRETDFARAELRSELDWVASQPTEARKKLAQFLVDHVQFISQAEFEAALQESVARFNQQVKEPYVALFYDENDSSKWTLDIALGLGLRPPEKILIGHGPHFKNWLLEHPEIRHAVIFDDAAFTGSQLLSRLDFLFNKHRPEEFKRLANQANLHLVLPFITRQAQKAITKSLGKQVRVNFYNSRTIPTIADLFKQAGFFRGWSLSNTFHDAFFSDFDALTYFEFHLPDDTSFFRPLRDIISKKGSFSRTKRPISSAVPIIDLTKTEQITDRAEIRVSEQNPRVKEILIQRFGNLGAADFAARIEGSGFTVEDAIYELEEHIKDWRQPSQTFDQTFDQVYELWQKSAGQLVRPQDEELMRSVIKFLAQAETKPVNQEAFEFKQELEQTSREAREKYLQVLTSRLGDSPAASVFAKMMPGYRVLPRHVHPLDQLGVPPETVADPAFQAIVRRSVVTRPGINVGLEDKIIKIRQPVIYIAVPFEDSHYVDFTHELIEVGIIVPRLFHETQKLGPMNAASFQRLISTEYTDVLTHLLTAKEKDFLKLTPRERKINHVGIVLQILDQLHPLPSSVLVPVFPYEEILNLLGLGSPLELEYRAYLQLFKMLLYRDIHKKPNIIYGSREDLAAALKSLKDDYQGRAELLPDDNFFSRVVDQFFVLVNKSRELGSEALLKTSTGSIIAEGKAPELIASPVRKGAKAETLKTDDEILSEAIASVLEAPDFSNIAKSIKDQKGIKRFSLEMAQRLLLLSPEKGFTENMVRQVLGEQLGDNYQKLNKKNKPNVTKFVSALVATNHSLGRAEARNNEFIWKRGNIDLDTTLRDMSEFFKNDNDLIEAITIVQQKFDALKSMKKEQLRFVMAWVFKQRDYASFFRNRIYRWPYYFKEDILQKLKQMAGFFEEGKNVLNLAEELLDTGIFIVTDYNRNDVTQSQKSEVKLKIQNALLLIKKINPDHYLKIIQSLDFIVLKRHLEKGTIAWVEPEIREVNVTIPSPDVFTHSYLKEIPSKEVVTAFLLLHELKHLIWHDEDYEKIFLIYDDKEEKLHEADSNLWAADFIFDYVEDLKTAGQPIQGYRVSLENMYVGIFHDLKLIKDSHQSWNILTPKGEKILEELARNLQRFRERLNTLFGSEPQASDARAEVRSVKDSLIEQLADSAQTWTQLDGNLIQLRKGAPYSALIPTYEVFIQDELGNFTKKALYFAFQPESGEIHQFVFTLPSDDPSAGSKIPLNVFNLIATDLAARNMKMTLVQTINPKMISLLNQVGRELEVKFDFQSLDHYVWGGEGKKLLADANRILGPNEKRELVLYDKWGFSKLDVAVLMKDEKGFQISPNLFGTGTKDEVNLNINEARLVSINRSQTSWEEDAIGERAEYWVPVNEPNTFFPHLKNYQHVHPLFGNQGYKIVESVVLFSGTQGPTFEVIDEAGELWFQKEQTKAKELVLENKYRVSFDERNFIKVENLDGSPFNQSVLYDYQQGIGKGYWLTFRAVPQPIGSAQAPVRAEVRTQRESGKVLISKRLIDLLGIPPQELRTRLAAANPVILADLQEKINQQLLGRPDLIPLVNQFVIQHYQSSLQSKIVSFEPLDQIPNLALSDLGRALARLFIEPLYANARLSERRGFLQTVSGILGQFALSPLTGPVAEATVRHFANVGFDPWKALLKDFAKNPRALGRLEFFARQTKQLMSFDTPLTMLGNELHFIGEAVKSSQVSQAGEITLPDETVEERLQKVLTNLESIRKLALLKSRESGILKSIVGLLRNPLEFQSPISVRVHLTREELVTDLLYEPNTATQSVQAAFKEDPVAAREAVNEISKVLNNPTEFSRLFGGVTDGPLEPIEKKIGKEEEEILRGEISERFSEALQSMPADIQNQALSEPEVKVFQDNWSKKGVLFKRMSQLQNQIDSWKALRKGKEVYFDAISGDVIDFDQIDQEIEALTVSLKRVKAKLLELEQPTARAEVRGNISRVKDRKFFQSGVRLGERTLAEDPLRERKELAVRSSSVSLPSPDFSGLIPVRSPPGKKSELLREDVPQSQDVPTDILNIQLNTSDSFQKTLAPSSRLNLLQKPVNVGLPIAFKISLGEVQSVIKGSHEEGSFVNGSIDVNQIPVSKTVGGIVTNDRQPLIFMGDLNLNRKTDDFLPNSTVLMPATNVISQVSDKGSFSGLHQEGTIAKGPESVKPARSEVRNKLSEEIEAVQTAATESANLIADYILAGVALLRKDVQAPSSLAVSISLSKIKEFGVSVETVWGFMEPVIENRLNRALSEKKKEINISQALKALTQEEEPTVEQVYQALGLPEILALNSFAESILESIRGLRQVSLVNGVPEVSFTSLSREALNLEKVRVDQLVKFNKSGVVFFQPKIVSKDDVEGLAELVRNALAINPNLTVRVFISDAAIGESIKRAYGRLKNQRDGIKANQFKVLKEFREAQELSPDVVMASDLVTAQAMFKRARFLDGIRAANQREIPQTRQGLQGLFGASLELLLDENVEGLPSVKGIYQIDLDKFANFIAFVNFIAIQAQAKLRMARAA